MEMISKGIEKPVDGSSERDLALTLSEKSDQFYFWILTTALSIPTDSR